MGNDLRPYYDPETFDAGYSVTYRPGIGVVYLNGKLLVETLFSKADAAATKATNIGIRRTSILHSGRAVRLRDDTSILLPLWSNISSSSEIVSNLLRRLAKNYFKVILNQPFDAVRLLLQVGSFDISKTYHSTNGVAKRKHVKKTLKRKNKVTNSLEDDEGADFFFTNDSIATKPATDDDESVEESTDDDIYEPNPNAVSNGYIQPLSLHTVDMMSSLLSKEGTTSLWKATNISYIYQALSTTMISWFTGFFSPFLEIPDPFYIDINFSPDPSKSLILILFASVATGLLLAPIDLIRTKFIITKITPSSKNSRLKRSLRDNLRMLQSYFCPLQLLIPTILNSLINSLIKNSTPFVFSTKLQLDSSSKSYEFFKLLAEFVELFFKLPIETILRRAQTSYLINRAKNEEMGDSNGLEVSKNDLVVAFTGYNGAFDTIFNSIYHGTKEDNPFNDNYGVQSLYRGWRIGVLNISARWGFRMTNNSDSQFVEERF